MASELLAGLDLTANQCCLRSREKTRAGAAPHTAGEAEVGAVSGLWVVGTRATGFTALNVAFGERTSAHRLGLGKLCSKIKNARGDFVRIGHGASLRLY